MAVRKQFLRPARRNGLANEMIASLKLSALRVANIPPPMSLHQIDLANNAIDVAISASNKRVAVLSENDVSIYAFDIHKKPIPAPSVLWRSAIPRHHYSRQVAFKGDTDVLVLTDKREGGESALWRCREEKVELQERIEGFGCISNLFPGIEGSRLYLQSVQGSVLEVVAEDDFSNTAEELRFRLIAKFPSPTPWVQVACYANNVLPIFFSMYLEADVFHRASALDSLPAALCMPMNVHSLETARHSWLQTRI